MSSIAGTFTIAPGAAVAVLCSTSRNVLHLHTAGGPPVVGADAILSFEECDLMTFASTAAALDTRAAAVDIFGNEIGAVAHMTKCTILHNWSVRSYLYILLPWVHG